MKEEDRKEEWRQAMVTAALRRRIEVEHECWFWGTRYRCTPRLVTKSFGDGKQLLAIEPLDTRPDYYVIRVGSDVDYLGTAVHPDGRWLLDHVYEAIEDEYGRRDLYEEEGEEWPGFPVFSYGSGVGWSAAYWPDGWLGVPSGTSNLAPKEDDE